VPSAEPADIILIGAGLAGATAASVLARQGRRVVLIDRWSSYPSCFKAEKIEPDQADLFRKFGLLSVLSPAAGHIRGVVGVEDGRVLGTRRIEQYGILYHDMVNVIRRALPPGVEFVTGRVSAIDATADLQTVTLVGGGTYTARLVAVACGVGGDLLTRLGIRKRMVRRDQSIAFGFSIAAHRGGAFPFDALTFYPGGTDRCLAYLTLFRMRDVMRANLFAYWPPAGELPRRFISAPHDELLRNLPGLARVIGNFDVVSKPEFSRIDLYTTENPVVPGIVLLGDSFQSVCPTTGSGLSKVLTDVDVLCHDCLPAWLGSAGMAADKIAGFYANRRKIEADRKSLADASFNREIAVNDAWRWRAQRVRRQWGRQLSGLVPTMTPMPG
jgi:2-polyprenyl-6-methoxyphenol hydroxylase-like FAD-dependent oxidoreductase